MRILRIHVSNTIRAEGNVERWTLTVDGKVLIVGVSAIHMRDALVDLYGFQFRAVAPLMDAVRANHGVLTLVA